MSLPPCLPPSLPAPFNYKLIKVDWGRSALDVLFVVTLLSIFCVDLPAIFKTKQQKKTHYRHVFSFAHLIIVFRLSVSFVFFRFRFLEIRFQIWLFLCINHTPHCCIVYWFSPPPPFFTDFFAQKLNNKNKVKRERDTMKDSTDNSILPPRSTTRMQMNRHKPRFQSHLRQLHPLSMTHLIVELFVHVQFKVNFALLRRKKNGFSFSICLRNEIGTLFNWITAVVQYLELSIPYTW